MTKSKCYKQLLLHANYYNVQVGMFHCAIPSSNESFQVLGKNKKIMMLIKNLIEQVTTEGLNNIERRECQERNIGDYHTT